MDPVTAIASALVAGATAAASGVASKAVSDAYEGLKKLLIDTYKFVSTASLEKRPTNPAHREVVHDELKDNPAIAKDEAVLKGTQVLLEALAKEPKVNLTKWAIDIKVLESDKNIIAERVSGGIRGEHWKSKEDVRFSDVSSGNS